MAGWRNSLAKGDEVGVEGGGGGGGRKDEVGGDGGNEQLRQRVCERGA